MGESGYSIEIVNELPVEKFDTVIMAVAHNEFTNICIESLLNERSVIFDVKGFMDRTLIDGRL